MDGGVQRSEFEGWIAPELAPIEAAVDAALADADLAPGADRPGVPDRRLVAGAGGARDLPPPLRAARIETGAELESIASGLALMGRERDLTRWTTPRRAA